MGHRGAYSPGMVVLTCFINFYFINSLLQKPSTHNSFPVMNPGYGQTDEQRLDFFLSFFLFFFNRVGTMSNTVKTKSVIRDIYVTSEANS